LPSDLLGGVETAIASMLLTRVAADRILGFSLFLPLSLFSDSKSARAEGWTGNEATDMNETNHV